MPSPSQSTHRISGPAELLDAVPYLLGFHPTESLVLVGVGAGMLGAAARLDLSDAGQLDVVEHTVAVLSRGGADRVVLAVFDDDCELPASTDGRRFAPLPWQDAVSAVSEAASSVGVEVAEALLVRRGRWWSFLCDLAECCPLEGSPLAAGPTPYATAAAYDGVVAMPSRAALAGTLEPLPANRRAALEPLVTAAENATVGAVLEGRVRQHERALVRELLLLARTSAAPGWQPPTDDTAARLCVALRSLTIRDEVWIAVDSRRLDGQALWLELARRCPAPYDAAPMFLFAWGNWRSGNGALAAMATERILLSDPTYSAADLLLAALEQAVDPRTFPLLTDAGPTPGVKDRRRPGRRGGAARRLR